MTRLSFVPDFSLCALRVSWDLNANLGIPVPREMGPEVTASGI